MESIKSRARQIEKINIVIGVLSKFNNYLTTYFGDEAEVTEEYRKEIYAGLSEQYVDEAIELLSDAAAMQALHIEMDLEKMNQ